MTLILTILVYLTLFWILGAFSQVVWLSALRVKITGVKLFYGQTPVKFSVGGCPVSIGWIPMGSTVSFDPIDLQQRSWSVRILGHLISTFVGLGVALLLLGYQGTWHHFLSGFQQIAEGAWEPIARAGDHLTRWQQVVDASPVKAFGILAAKGAALSLFPMGGGVISQMLGDVGSSTGKESLEKLAVFNAIAGIMIIALWAFAGLWLALFR